MADIELVIKMPEEMYKWANDVNRFFFEDYGISDFIDLVKNATPLPKGHWIYWHTNGFGRKIYKCSKCNWDGDTAGFNFCPNCGAKMIEP